MNSPLKQYKDLVRLVLTRPDLSGALFDSLRNCSSNHEINALLDHLIAQGYTLEELLEMLVSRGFNDSHAVVKLLNARIANKKNAVKAILKPFRKNKKLQPLPSNNSKSNTSSS